MAFLSVEMRIEFDSLSWPREVCKLSFYDRQFVSYFFSGFVRTPDNIQTTRIREREEDAARCANICEPYFFRHMSCAAGEKENRHELI